MFLGGRGLYILKIIGMIELGPTFRIFSTNLENATRIKIQFGKGWRNQALYGNKAELGIYNVDDNTSKEHSNLIQPQKGFCLEAELRISIREKKTMVSSQKEILFNQIKVHRNLRVPEFSWVETRSSYKTLLLLVTFCEMIFGGCFLLQISHSLFWFLVSSGNSLLGIS